MEHRHSYSQRKLLLTWLILPAILLWFTTNYLIGIFRPPSWQNNKSTNSLIALSNDTKQNERETIPVVPKYQWQGTGLVTLWFDDAWISQYTIAYPMVEQYGFKAALAVPTHVIGYDAYMGLAQIRRLQAKGWEITSHTRTHDCNLYREDQKTVEFELGGASSDLKQLGFESNNFVSPCGVNSPLMQRTAQKYYTSFRTSTAGFNTIPVGNPYNLVTQTMRNTTTRNTVSSWLKTANDEHKWLILVIHQIDDPTSSYSITTSMLHEILDELSKDNLPVVLPTQVLELENLDAKSATVSATPTNTINTTQSIQSEIQE